MDLKSVEDFDFFENTRRSHLLRYDNYLKPLIQLWILLFHFHYSLKKEKAAADRNRRTRQRVSKSIHSSNVFLTVYLVTGRGIEMASWRSASGERFGSDYTKY